MNCRFRSNVTLELNKSIKRQLIFQPTRLSSWSYAQTHQTWHVKPRYDRTLKSSKVDPEEEIKPGILRTLAHIRISVTFGQVMAAMDSTMKLSICFPPLDSCFTACKTWGVNIERDNSTWSTRIKTASKRETKPLHLILLSFLIQIRARL